MCKYINSWAEIARALVVVTVMSLLGLAGVHIYEYVTPTSHYFEYKSVIPAKDAFQRGDTIEFISSVVRHRAIETQWQDRLYCDNGKYIEKYPTQIIPSNSTEYMQAGEYTSLWKYSYSIEPDEQKCRMCGNVVGVTSYGYKKCIRIARIGSMSICNILTFLFMNPKETAEAIVKMLDQEKMAELIANSSDGYHTFKELYAYRRAYNALLVNEYAKQGLYNVHKSQRHSDGKKCFGGGWFVVQITLPTGQISNHYEMKYWNDFHCEEREMADEWDGHTPQEALKRMLLFLKY